MNNNLFLYIIMFYKFVHIYIYNHFVQHNALLFYILLYHILFTINKPHIFYLT